MPKLVGIPYYNAVKQGVDQAASEIKDDTTVIWQGPTTDQVDKQIEMLDNAISAKPSVIAVAADDPAAIVPVLKKAKAAGSHVMTWDGDADFRECFVNFVNYDAFGAALVEEMVKQVGQTADVAVVTSTLTTPNQTAWLAAMRKTIADKHPGMGACAWTSRCSSPAGSSRPAPTLILGESSWNSLSRPICSTIRTAGFSLIQAAIPKQWVQRAGGRRNFRIFSHGVEGRMPVAQSPASPGPQSR